MTDVKESIPPQEEIVDFSIDYMTPDKQKDVILNFIQEKKNIQKQLDEKTKEVNKKNAEIYDLKSEITRLKVDFANLKKEHDNLKSNISKRPVTAKRSSQLNRNTAPTPKKAPSTLKKRVSELKLAVASKQPEEPTTNGTEGNHTQKADEKESLLLKHYQDVAQQFPELKLSIVLRAENMFSEADADGNGTIDEGELEAILEKQGFMATKKLVRDVMKEIDKDETGTIDKAEYFAILDRLQQRRSTNLPPEVAKSQACILQ